MYRAVSSLQYFSLTLLLNPNVRWQRFVFYWHKSIESRDYIYPPGWFTFRSHTLKHSNIQPHIRLYGERHTVEYMHGHTGKLFGGYRQTNRTTQTHAHTAGIEIRLESWLYAISASARIWMRMNPWTVARLKRSRPIVRHPVYYGVPCVQCLPVGTFQHVTTLSSGISQWNNNPIPAHKIITVSLIPSPCQWFFFLEYCERVVIAVTAFSSLALLEREYDCGCVYENVQRTILNISSEQLIYFDEMRQRDRVEYEKKARTNSEKFNLELDSCKEKWKIFSSNVCTVQIEKPWLI